MEFAGKKWQLRLLAGLLSVFVTLYFMTDLFGGISAESDSDEESSIVEVSGELSEGDGADGTVDVGVPDEDGSTDQSGDSEDVGSTEEVGDPDESGSTEEAGEDEEFAGDGVMLFAMARAGGDYSMLDTPFEITKVDVRINGVPLQENGTMAIKNEDKFSLEFDWEMTDGQPHKDETFSYDLNNHLQGITLHDTVMAVDYTDDGIPDAYYEVNGNVLTLKIGNTKDYKNYKGGFTITGVIDMDGVPKDDDGKFTIQFGNDKTFDLIDLRGKPSLNVNKQAVGEVYSDGGKYWQKFTITVTNDSETAAQNVKLYDQSGTLFTGDIRGLTVSKPGAGSSFPLDLGEVKPGDRVEVTYELELDRAKMLGGNDNYNSTWIEADKLLHFPSDGDYARYEIPSFSKAGTHDANTGTITWTITFKPGFMKDEDWTIKDKDGQYTWSKPAGSSDATYTFSFTENAPQADPYVYTTVENTAEVIDSKGNTATAKGTVKIPPNGTTNYINKSHGDVTVNGDEALVPWVIRVTIPDTDVTSVVIDDDLEMTNYWVYANHSDQIENLYGEFTIKDAGGKVYTTTAADGEYLYTIAGVGALKRLWYGENVHFQLVINDQSFLKQNRKQEITISYPLHIKAAEISTVKNTAKMITTLANGKEFPDQDDSDTYRRNIIVTKVQDYNGAASKYPRYAHSWKVTLTNSGGASAGDIVFKDTLPQDYELCQKTDGSYEVRLTDASGKAISPKAVALTADGFTVTVDQSYSNQNLNLYYTAQMTEACYQKVSNTTKGAFTYTNKIEATTSNGKGAAKDTFTVYTDNSSYLTKEVISTTPNISAGEFKAKYRIDINRDKKPDLVAPVTVTDRLGSAMELDGSPVIKKLTGSDPSNSRDWTTVTNTITFTNNSGVLTFTGFQNETYYRIEYQVKGKALYKNELTANLPEVKDELEKRFGNTVELEAGDGFSKNSSITLSDNYYRQGAYILFSLSLKGTKLWENTPAGTKEPDEVEIQLTRTETKVNGVQDFKTYSFKLRKGEVVAGGDGEFKPSVQWNGDDWSFDIDNLTLRDSATGSDYTYQLSEVGVAGYETSYQYKTSNMTDWKPVVDALVGVNSGAILNSNKSGSIDAKIINTYTGTTPQQPTTVSEVSIQKTDMTGGAGQIAGAKLTITGKGDFSGVTVTDGKDFSSTDSSISFTTTDKIATVKGLPEGRYTLTETAAPSGYTVTSDFYFTIDSKGNVTKTAGADNGNINTLTGKTIVLKDKAIELTIKKTDKDTGSLLAGAKFTIQGKPGADFSNVDIEGASGKPSVDEKTAAITFTTRANTAVTIKGIPAGPYTLTETQAPSRYKTASPQSFTVNSDGTVTGFANNTITVQNEIVTGALNVKKVDEQGNPLSGAVFTIRANSTVDWSRVSFGAVKGSGKSVSHKFTVAAGDGILEIKGLPIGIYTLTETDAPNGYLLAKTFRFRVTDTGAITSLDTPDTGRYDPAAKTVTLEDKRVKDGTIAIAKFDAENHVMIAGARIRLTRTDGSPIGSYSAENITDEAPSGNILEFTTTDNQAQIQITGLKDGTYEIEEIDAPSGYICLTKKETITISEKKPSASVTIENKATKVSVNKVDMTDGGKQLEGAELTITGTGDFSNVTVTGADSVKLSGSSISFTTTGEIATITGLPAGEDYTLTETAAPSGYIVTSEFYFTIGKDGKVSQTNGKDNGKDNKLAGDEITLKDAPTEIFIKKVDMANSKQLPGATLLIQGKSGMDFSNVKVSGADQSHVDTVKATVTLVTGNADAVIRGLPEGDYELTETVAPTGYQKTTTKFKFTIEKNGKVTASTNTTTAPGNADITLNDKTITVENKPTNPNTPGGNTPGGSTPGGNTPGGNTPGGNTPGGNTPGGNTPGGNTPGGNTPESSNSSETTKPAGESSDEATTTTVRGAQTTASNRVTTTEPKKTTKRTSANPAVTTVPDAAVTTTVPKKTTAVATDEPDSGIDSNQHTTKDDNPHTGVPFTSLAAVFAATGALAVVTRKRKKN